MQTASFTTAFPGNIIINSSGDTVAAVTPGRPDSDTLIKLFTAAPKLLAMVKDYAENADCGDGGCDRPFGDCWHCSAVQLVAEAGGTLNPEPETEISP
jgi:hypothetical protein